MSEMNKLFVGNLSFGTKQSNLEQAFGQFGSIEECKVIEDRETGRSRGFGFVTFATKEAAQAALAMDGKELDGRPLRVNFAQEKERGEGGGGGGGRGGNGGGGRGGWR